MREFGRELNECIGRGDVVGSIKIVSGRVARIGVSEVQEGIKRGDVSRVVKAGCLTVIVYPAAVAATASLALAAAFGMKEKIGHK